MRGVVRGEVNRTAIASAGGSDGSRAQHAAGDAERSEAASAARSARENDGAAATPSARRETDRAAGMTTRPAKRCGLCSGLEDGDAELPRLVD